MTNRIPENIVEACAKAAYEMTALHYNGHVNARLAYEQPHVQKRVKKDVLAVLLGNRTAEQLHYQWSTRKMKAAGDSFNRMRENHPTATKAFHQLSEHDRQGYELFVKTVKDTYAKLTEIKSGHYPAEKTYLAAGDEALNIYLPKGASSFGTRSIPSESRYTLNIEFNSAEVMDQFKQRLKFSHQAPAEIQSNRPVGKIEALGAVSKYLDALPYEGVRSCVHVYFKDEKSAGDFYENLSLNTDFSKVLVFK